jgi:hypothetical protein
VIASQSRQENFSRTCSIIFQRRGSHSKVFDTTSPSLCSRSRRPRIWCALRLGGLWRGDLGLGFLFGLGLFKVLDGELELLDQQLAAFGGLSELLASCLGQHQLQPLDFQPADRDLASRQRQQFTLRKDHCMRCGKVGGKRIGGRRHDDESTIFATKNRARFPL